MKYECKLTVKDRKATLNQFKIYIKYKPVTNKFYNPFGNKIKIINYSSYIVWDTIFSREENKRLVNYIEEFNEMTSKEMVDLVANHIKLKEIVEVRETHKSIRLDSAISVAKQKANIFIVEVK